MRARLMWTALALTACAVQSTPVPSAEPAIVVEPPSASGGESSAGARPGGESSAGARPGGEPSAGARPGGEPSAGASATPGAIDATGMPTPPCPIRIPADVERAIDDAVHAALTQRQLPGAVIAIGRRDGLVFLRDYGVRASDPSVERNDVDTIYDLASLTKPIATTTALAILAERGALSFDDPVARFLPAFASHGKERVTIRQLLLHTGGLPAVDLLRDYEGETREQSLARIFALALVARPGARMLYSDLGFVVLGEVVAAAAGEPFEAFAQREIFAPLRMRSSTFRPGPDILARVAPTERAERRGGVMIRGVVHDPRAWRLGGVSGNAGLFASAADLARFARAMLGEGELEGARILSAESVRGLVAPTRLPGGFVNGLGWDLRSASEARANGGMSDASYGHLGWTGTSIRIDPRLDVFAIVLTNDVHPDGHGDVRPLAAALERIVASAAGRMVPPPQLEVLSGIDVEQRDGYPHLRGAHVVLVTHDAARARDGRRTLDLLAASTDVELLRVLAPEHGLGVDREGHIGDARDERTGLPVLGLFGATRTPTDAMLEGADTLVIDLVDVGARFYTYASTMHQALVAAAARADLRVVILDRPNPIGGTIIEGPALDPELRSFVNHHRLPLRHGLTIGELARLLDAELGLGLDERLVIVRAEGWTRDATVLSIAGRWTPPSPNLPDAESALLYPAVALLEGADVSVGRGTSEPFRVIGAPWMDSARVLAELAAIDVPGVAFEAARFTPRSARHRGRACRGVRVMLRDPSVYRAAQTGLAIVRAVIAVHRDRVDLARVLPLVGSRRVLDAVIGEAGFEQLVAMTREDAAAFEARRAPYLLY